MAYSKEFCSRYGAYDNSGLLLDCKNEVKAAVFALDLSKDAVKAAEKRFRRRKRRCFRTACTAKN